MKPNPSIEATNTGGQRSGAFANAVSPVFAPHFQRYASVLPRMSKSSARFGKVVNGRRAVCRRTGLTRQDVARSGAVSFAPHLRRMHQSSVHSTAGAFRQFNRRVVKQGHWRRSFRAAWLAFKALCHAPTPSASNVALHNLSVSLARQWLAAHGLLEAASTEELRLLNTVAPLDERQKGRLRWNIESLWAAVWSGGFVDELSPTQPITGTLVSLLPDLRAAESPDRFLGRFRLRGVEDLYEKLDLFYRAHWYARDCQLAGRNSEPFELGVVQCRRQLLEWAMHAEADWDDVDLST